MPSVEEETQRIMQKGFDTLADLIADLIRETNEGLAATRTELGARIAENGERIAENGARIAENGTRLDNLISIAGRETRALRRDVDDLVARVEALETKAS